MGAGAGVAGAGGVESFVGSGMSAAESVRGFLIPSEAKSSVVPRFSIAVLPNDLGEKVAATVSGTSRMRNVRIFPEARRDSECPHSAEEQHDASARKNRNARAITPRRTPAIGTYI